MPQPAHRPLQLPLHHTLLPSPLTPCGKSCKQSPVGQALQRSAYFDLVTGSLPCIPPPAGESAKQGLVGEAHEGVLQGSSIVMEPAAGASPGVEGAQQSGVAHLG